MHTTMRKDKQPRVFICVLLVFLIFALLTVVLEDMSPSALARSGERISATCGLPTIDGHVSTIEWSDAATLTVQLITNAPVAPFTTTLHVMNSANYLYMGFTINDDEFSPLGKYLPEGDAFIIIFDDDLSGSLHELENNVLALAAGDPQFEDRYMYNLTGSNQADIEGGGTADGAGAASRADSLNHFEAKFPLCSEDTLDFCLHPDEVTGFRLEYLDAEADEGFGSSQFFPGVSETSIAELAIGVCSAVPDLFIYLPLIMR